MADHGSRRLGCGTVVFEGIARRNLGSRWFDGSGKRSAATRHAASRRQRGSILADVSYEPKERRFAATRRFRRQVAATAWSGREQRRQLSTGRNQDHGEAA